MTTFTRSLAVFAMLSVLACASFAGNTWIEQGRAHAAAGAFGCTVSGATVATPSVITCTAAHGLVDGDQVQVTGIVGTTTDNTTAYVKVTGYSTTTFALYSDAGLSTGVTGTGSYSSGGKVSIARDVSGLTGDFTARIGINGMTPAKNAVVCLQDSADGFVNDTVNLWCVNVQGGSSSGVNVPVIWATKRYYEMSSARLGVTNARFRLSVQSLDSGATVTTSLFIEQ